MSENIQVVVRCRARNDNEVLARSPSIVELPDPVSSLQSPYISVNLSPENHGSNSVLSQRSNPSKSQKRFKVDTVYGPGASQSLLFDNVALPLFNDFLLGSNVTILAYGQTGLGKTHTMSGDLSGDGAGIIPRVLSRLFSLKSSDFMVKLSCVELYKEELRDLIDDDLGILPIRAKLRLVPDQSKDATAPKIQNLCELPIDNTEMALKIVEKCLGKRRMAATKLNDQSSRSHTILSITLYREIPSSGVNSQFRVSRMNLVDLAGSEDIHKSGAVNERAREAGSINQSLLSLGKVINCLSEGKDPKHIPYRESKLTRLLQGLLGGKTKTALIATISPAQINASETLSTLNYASKAKNIKNLPQSINDSDAMLKKVLVSDLSSQIARLTRDLMASKDKDESVKISQQNYLEYTSNVTNLQSHLQEKATHLQSLKTALDLKNSEIDLLQSKVSSAENKLSDIMINLSNRDNEMTRLNEQFVRLQERYLQQNQKLGEIMENNISSVNETLKQAILSVSGDRTRISNSLEASKRRIIDDLISSQGKLAKGIEELQKLLDVRELMDSVFELDLTTDSFKQVIADFDTRKETLAFNTAEQNLRIQVEQALNSEAHKEIVEELVHHSHREAGLSKQRLLAELSNTVETMFNVHQGKFEQALHQVAKNVLNSAENSVVEKLDLFQDENKKRVENLEQKTINLKHKFSDLNEKFMSSKSAAKDQLLAAVETQLSRGVTELTGTALQETDGAEKGILLSFEILSKQVSQSGQSFQRNITAATTDLSRFAQKLSSLDSGTPSPHKKAMLAARLINTLGSPNPKKRKQSPLRMDEKLQQTRIPQLSPVNKRK